MKTETLHVTETEERILNAALKVVNDVTIRIIIDAMKVAREITSFLSISFFDMVGRIA